MNQNIAHEILHELFSSLEALDTQSAALLQFLKDKGIATEKELAPYLEQAGNASNVRWLAARVRVDHLISSAMKAPERDVTKEPAQPSEDTRESSGKAEPERSGKKETVIEKTPPSLSPATSSGEPEPHPASAGKDQPEDGEDAHKNTPSAILSAN